MDFARTASAAAPAQPPAGQTDLRSEELGNRENPIGVNTVLGIIIRQTDRAQPRRNVTKRVPGWAHPPTSDKRTLGDVSNNSTNLTLIHVNITAV